MPCILTADDSWLARRHISNALRTDGYELIEAKDGEEALEIATTQAPDCMLLDLMMPKMNGLKVLEALRANNLRVPVIVISEHMQEAIEARCRELGAFGILDKPLNKNSLRKAIKEALNVEHEQTTS